MAEVDDDRAPAPAGARRAGAEHRTPTAPPRVDYELTPSGEHARVDQVLGTRSDRHEPEVAAARAAYDARPGEDSGAA
ncbi:hypothetical protein ACFFSW_31885 [Saccharothrix longispora]|uniref:Transcriptional regulator n=1 Tax=Saccharothrix longispora TaxID=33920 RepID=A0ABU1Q1J3_9PSEU|nr:hypothetical protein [Saccharothrix longispora]MDR6596749.1 hypothetical protein [Saccharothrix longispora]